MPITPIESKAGVAQSVFHSMIIVRILSFAGLRPTEACRVQWKDFNEKTQQLFVRKGKTPARHVAPEPAPLAWMEYHRENTPQTAPFVNLTNLENQMKVIRKAVFNGEWIQDGLRRGFRTYYKAQTKDIEKSPTRWATVWQSSNVTLPGQSPPVNAKSFGL